MGIFSFIPIIGKFIDKALGIIDKYIPDKDLANKLKSEIKQEILVNNHEELMKELDAKMQIILAEAKGSWLQRNWRPILMLSIVAIIVNNYIFYPYMHLFGLPATSLQLPDSLFNLMTIGIGGYIAGRTIEKLKKVD